MTLMHNLPELLIEAGLNVKVLDGWEQPAKSGYLWREPDTEPAGHMIHHTATTAYTPNRDKASIWIGMGTREHDRLYQSGSGMDAWVVVANAWPAPISSGYGVRSVLEDYVKQDKAFTGKQTQPDDDWAGNTHYINTEVICDGVGGRVTDQVWHTIVTTADVINGLYRWTPARHVGHAHHTGRKIDFRDGRYADADHTVQALRSYMTTPDASCPWDNPCSMHYNRDDWPEGSKGVCNVPEGQQAAIDWNVAERRIIVEDDFRDDYNRMLSDGRYWVQEWRAAGKP